MPDVIEKLGIPLSNGKVVVTDPNKADTDGDGLKDGEEVEKIPYTYHKSHSKLLDLFRIDLIEGYTFKTYSDPSMKDSDSDGIDDYKETKGFDFERANGYKVHLIGAPLIKGILNGFCGELTIVSSVNGLSGHAFLVYKSIINDVLDFKKLTYGYKYNYAKDKWEGSEPCLYYIKSSESVAIGNAGNSAFGSSLGSQLSESASTGIDQDKAGIYFNREFAYQHGEDKKLYDKNFAYSKFVKKDEIDKIIDFCNANNYYKLFGNNCAQVASKAWNKAFENEDFDIIVAPYELAIQISKKLNHFTYDVDKVAKP